MASVTVSGPGRASVGGTRRATRHGPAANELAVSAAMLDRVGAPDNGNERERVTVVRAAGLPGAEVWRVERSLRYWRVFHESYSFCSVDAGWSGEALWRYRGRELAMSPTAQQLFEPGQAHHTFRLAGPPAFFHVLQLDAATVALLLGRQPPHLQPFTSEPVLRTRLLRACRAVRAGGDPLDSEVALAEFVNDLFEAVAERRSAPDRLDPRDWRVARVREMIHHGYREDLSVQRLAGAVGLSPARLVSLFRRCTSLPVHQYLIALRLAKARTLLAGGMRPSDAALACGFYDLRHFGREMKARLGFTPSHYFSASPPRARDR